MALLEYFRKLNTENKIAYFYYYDQENRLSFPAIVYFKGESSEKGKGYSVMFDFDRVLEIWANEEIEPTEELLEVKEKLSKEFGLEYRVEILDLPTDWESFNEYIYFFVESGELDIVEVNFENEKAFNEDYLEIFYNSIEHLKIIGEKAYNIINKQNNIINLEVVSSGKMILFSIDTQHYIKISKKLETDIEKKFLWLILNVILKINLLKYGEKLNPSPVNRGILGIFVDKINASDLRKSLEILNTRLHVTEEQVVQFYNENKHYIENLQNVIDINQKISNENKNTVIEIIENLLIQHIISKEKSLAQSILDIGEDLKKLNL